MHRVGSRYFLLWFEQSFLVELYSSLLGGSDQYWNKTLVSSFAIILTVFSTIHGGACPKSANWTSTAILLFRWWSSKVVPQQTLCCLSLVLLQVRSQCLYGTRKTTPESAVTQTVPRARRLWLRSFLVSLKCFEVRSISLLVYWITSSWFGADLSM